MDLALLRAAGYPKDGIKRLSNQVKSFVYHADRPSVENPFALLFIPENQLLRKKSKRVPNWWRSRCAAFSPELSLKYPLHGG